MPRNWRKFRICVLALSLFLLAAQFHFCADLASGAGTSHFCPFCATAGTAVAAIAPVIGLAPANGPVECKPAQIQASADAWFTIAPRAPPAL